jgi:hypothetical protein
MTTLIRRVPDRDTHCISRFLRAETRRAKEENENEWRLSAAMELYDVRARYLAAERQRARAALLEELHLKPERRG